MASPRTPPAIADDDEQSFSAWPLLIVIGTAKVATLLVVVVFAWDTESAALIGATAIPWIVAIGGLVSVPLVWQWRVRKARRKRAALLRAEWMLTTDKAASPRSARQPPPVSQRG